MRVAVVASSSRRTNHPGARFSSSIQLGNHEEQDQELSSPPSSPPPSSPSSSSTVGAGAGTGTGAGFLVLLTVPVAWGTYEPAVRYVYALDPPVPGFIFSFSYFFIAAVALTITATTASLRMPASNPNNNTTRFWGGGGGGGDNVHFISLSDRNPNQTDSWPIQEGIELGTYLVIGNALQLLSLETISSDRAAFLLQLKTILVPLLEASLAGSLSLVTSMTWLACFLALAGVAFMGLDGGGQEAAASTAQTTMTTTTTTMTTEWPPSSLAVHLSMGDGLIIAAAVIYSFHIIRLETIAKQVSSALQLAAVKASTECAWTALLIAILATYANIVNHNHNHNNDGTTAGFHHETALFGFAAKQGSSIHSYLSYLINGGDTTTYHHHHQQQLTAWDQIVPAVGATFWTGLVTIAYTIYAQSIGQKTVNAVTANLIYTIQPLCTALFAGILLGERLGPQGYVGAVLIGGAVLLSSSSVKTEKKNE